MRFSLFVETIRQAGQSKIDSNKTLIEMLIEMLIERLENAHRRWPNETHGIQIGRGAYIYKLFEKTEIFRQNTPGLMRLPGF